MGKKPCHTPKLTKKYHPFVSICTPTFNRRPFIQNMFQCFKNQDYPKDRMEWIIVDDGTDKIRDLVEASGIKQIKYFELPEQMTLGAKRNYMHTKTIGSIIVYMDDDDYYPPERVSHAVDTLTKNKEALCCGSSEIYIYFKHIQKMIQCGPYGPKHATAGTFAFRKELLNQTKYNDNASLAEEREFLKNYTIPFAQLDPLKSILVFSHEHNTFDKRKLLENPHPNFLKESDKTIEMFIRQSKEEPIKQFFLKDIDELLKKYEPGEPKMKPKVLEQIKEIESEREKMIQEYQKTHMNGQTIMLQQDGKPPRALAPNEVITIIQQMQQQMEKMAKEIYEKDALIKTMQMQLIQKSKGKSESESESGTKTPNTKSIFNPELFMKMKDKPKSEEKPVVVKSKSDPEVMITI